MKISKLIKELKRMKRMYGDLEVTVSETLWMYNPVTGLVYVENAYEDSDEAVIEIQNTGN